MTSLCPGPCANCTRTWHDTRYSWLLVGVWKTRRAFGANLSPSAHYLFAAEDHRNEAQSAQQGATGPHQASNGLSTIEGRTQLQGAQRQRARLSELATKKGETLLTLPWKEMRIYGF